MKKITLTFLKVLAVAAFWIGIWCLVAYRTGNDFLFPSLPSVLEELFRLLKSADFWLITCTSLLRVVWGILVSLIIGTALAVLTSISKILRALLSPALSAVKSTPVASFIILALLWMERDILPVFITALIVIPIVWANVSEGVRRVDHNLVEVATVYRFSILKRTTRLYVPSVAPYFMAACRSALGMAWKAGIAAEILATPKSAIGTELYYSKTYLETPTLFAWTLVVILLSLVIEKLLVYGLECMGIRLKILRKGDRYAEG